MKAIVSVPSILSLALAAGIAVRAAPQTSPSVLPAPVTAANITATDAPGGSAYNIRLAPDASPDLTDLDSFIHTTTSQWPTAREKVRSLFYWTHILRRQTSPMVLHGHEVTDPIKNFQDYGFTMCSTATGINQMLYEKLGLKHQYWDISGHTVANVEYDGAYHMVDSAFSNLVTTDDGVTLASVQEAAANSARLVKERSLHSSSPFGFLTGSDYIRPLADTPTASGVLKGYASSFCCLHYRDYYYNWNAGHRYVLNLRENESYTRYYRPLAATPLPPEYWVGSENVDTPDPANKSQIDAANQFGNRGNGTWAFVPSLATAEWERAAYAATNITRGAIGLQPSSAAATGEVIYKAQGANAIASQTIDAQFTVTSLNATATVALSLNHGLTWTDVGSVSQLTGAIPLTLKLRDQVNGFYETLIRFRMNAGADGGADAVALTAVRIDTITSLNVHALPKLNVGRNDIFVGLGEQTDTMVLWPDLRGDLWRQDAFDFSNVSSQPVDVPRAYTAVAYPAVLTQDAHLTYRMVAPQDLTKVVYGGRLFNRQAGGYIDFLHSFDEGATWTRSYRLDTTNRPYDVNSYNNDSVFVQFDHSVDSSGAPIWRINTAEATTVVLEDCGGCGLAGWGWADNGYGANVLGPVVYFNSPGPHRLRVQAREDGLGIDQIVLSAVTYSNVAPGAPRNDTTILAATAPPLTTAAVDEVDEVVLYAAADASVTGGWVVTPDTSAAGGARLQNPNAGATKLTTALANPVNAFDLTFTADAGKPYRIWIRGRALNDSYNNDSVFVQFDKAVDQSGAPVWRFGTTSATVVILEEASGSGVQGWGWTDNGYGSDGPLVYFAESGTQRLRIQSREDGLAIDQVVLSAVTYLTASPGSARNDTLIVPR